MTIRRNGVMGGPRVKPIQPKRKPGFFPEQQTPEVVVVKPEDQVETFLIPNKEEDVVVALTPIKEVVEKIIEEDTFDCVEEEDKNPSVESMFPPQTINKLQCDICGFISKSKKGLKSHKKWKHSVIASS